MKAGQLGHKVKLQSLVPGQDEIGQPTMVWGDVATLWADIRFVRGHELIRSDSPISIAKCSIRIRFRSITAGQRIIEGTTVYDIKAVLPDPNGTRFVDLACEVGANNG